MTSSQAWQTFDELADWLLRVGSALSPSELQGYVVGRLCIQSLDGQTDWLADLDGFISASAQLQGGELDLLDKYSRHMNRQLQDPELSFQLLLPDDDDDLLSRVESLGDWCQSFLLGYSVTGKVQSGDSEDDVADILADITAIAQIGFDEDELDDEDEQEFFEVSEFVRVAVMNLYLVAHPSCSELQKQLNNTDESITAPSSGLQNHSLH